MSRTNSKNVARDALETTSRVLTSIIEQNDVLRARHPALAAIADAKDTDTDAVAQAAASQRNGGFRSLSELCRTVIENPDDRRLVRAPTGAGEVDSTAGGFLVPPAWSQNILRSIYANSVLLPMCDLTQVDDTGTSYVRRAIDEASRANGSRYGGVALAWAAEGAPITYTVPKWRDIGFKCHKLLGGMWSSSELWSDTGDMIEPEVTRVFGEEFAAMADQAIMAGTGAGQPLGLINSPCRITMPKELGQVPATIMPDNIRKMFSRLPRPSRSRAVWLINEDAESQLDSASFAGSAGGTTAPMYQSAGVNGSTYALLKGRPVVPVEWAPALGAEGDVTLVDLSQYLVVQGSPQTAISLHRGFDTDQIVLRLAFHIDGKPGWTSPITPFNGTNTRSPVVTLAAR